MTSTQWNDDEKKNYERLVKTLNGEDPAAEGLAYTAVMEMCHARQYKEKMDAYTNNIRQAIFMMAEGIRQLEFLLGISIKEMADKAAEERLKLVSGRLN